MAAKKTTYIEVNTPSNNHIKIFSLKPSSTRGSPVTQKLPQEKKNTNNMGPTPLTIILEQN